MLMLVILDLIFPSQDSYVSLACRELSQKKYNPRVKGENLYINFDSLGFRLELGDLMDKSLSLTGL